MVLIKSIRKLNKNCTIEILTPDFNKKKSVIDKFCNNLPDVFNHNLETVLRLYPKIRPG